MTDFVKKSPDNEEIIQLPDIEIKTVFGDCNLRSYIGHNLVLFFYPKDNTPGCTAQANMFTKLHNQFLDLDTQVVGVSRDSLRSHNNFTEKFGLSINLVSDESEDLCKCFDVIKEKNMYGKTVYGIERSTFFYDRNGILLKSWRKVVAEDNASEMLQFSRSIRNSLKGD